MIKTGIVISIKNKKAGIMTDSGEFLYIKTGKVFPKIGSIHRGELYKKNLFNYKYALTAASLMFILISSSFAYAYYSPVTTVVLSINPSVSLKANRWNKIISFKALNSDGSLILRNVNLKNKSIDTGLELLIKEAKVEDFINAEYINSKKVISVDISGIKDNSIDISNFKNIIDNNNLNIIINASSSNNKRIDITVNNKKVDTVNLNNNNNNNNNTEKGSTNNSNPMKKDLLNKPAPEINNSKTENKSSEIKKEIKPNDKTIKSNNNKFNKIDKPLNKNSSINSSTMKKLVTSNEIKNNLQYLKIKNVKTSNKDSDNNSENDSFKTEEKNRVDNHSDSSENQQNLDNVQNKFLRYFEN